MACRPGTGKTQSVVAWIAATWKLGLKLSVSVSAAHIEALCDIKRSLVAAGVPERAIGLRHAYGANASEPDTGELDRRIMLVSHSRMRGGGNTYLFSHHDGKPRDLLIWDETLMTADAGAAFLARRQISLRTPDEGASAKWQARSNSISRRRPSRSRARIARVHATLSFRRDTCRRPGGSPSGSSGTERMGESIAQGCSENRPVSATDDRASSRQSPGQACCSSANRLHGGRARGPRVQDAWPSARRRRRVRRG